MLARLFLCIVVAVAICPSLLAQSVTPDNDNNGNAPKASVDRDKDNTAAANKRDAENAKTRIDIDGFVAEHLPELTNLLDRLKQQGNGHYQRAARDLERSISRIENLKKRDSKLYEVELELWKTRSRLQFAAAEFAVKPPENEDSATWRIQSLLKKKAVLELQRLRVLRVRAAEQIAELDEQITKREADLKDDEAIKNLAEQYKRRYRTTRKK